MKVAVCRIIRKGVLEFSDQSSSTWIQLHSSQVVLAVSHLMWTIETSRCIDKRSEVGTSTDTLVSLLDAQNVKIEEIAHYLVQNRERGLEKRTVASLLTIYVHERDVLVHLINEKVVSIGAFAWVSQMRYYWSKEKELEDVKHALQRPLVSTRNRSEHRETMRVEHMQTQIEYGFEYTASSAGLVITPLTSRVLMAMSSALASCVELSGSGPSCCLCGPSGCGKSTLVSQFARMLGIHCAVYQCGYTSDPTIMTEYLAGNFIHPSRMIQE